jgi:hypothetical protein
MPLIECKIYTDKFGNLVEATFNVKTDTVIVLTYGIYERDYTYGEWQERTQLDEP